MRNDAATALVVLVFVLMLACVVLAVRVEPRVEDAVARSAAVELGKEEALPLAAVVWGLVERSRFPRTPADRMLLRPDQARQMLLLLPAVRASLIDGATPSASLRRWMDGLTAPQRESLREAWSGPARFGEDPARVVDAFDRVIRSRCLVRPPS